MDMILAGLMGVGLAAACGFRVFVPLLVVSIAAHTGHLQLTHSAQWMGSATALGVFGVATALEIAGYYIPWVDHLLDSIASPAAVVAGTVVTASFLGDMDPTLRWTLAAIAGGGTSGLIQVGTVLTRGLSLATTGGLGNPLVSTGEAVASTTIAIIAIVVPALVLVVLLILGYLLVTMLFRRRRAAAVAGVPVRTPAVWPAGR